MPIKKIWFITGAGRGLGVDIAKAALAAGHAVVATGRNAKKVAEAIGDHDETGGVHVAPLRVLLRAAGVSRRGSLEHSP